MGGKDQETKNYNTASFVFIVGFYSSVLVTISEILDIFMKTFKNELTYRIEWFLFNYCSLFYE